MGSARARPPGRSTSAAAAFRPVGDKWSVLITGTLADGPLRYSDLAAAIPGISPRVPTLTLKHLQRSGLVSRTSGLAVARLCAARACRGRAVVCGHRADLLRASTPRRSAGGRSSMRASARSRSKPPEQVEPVHRIPGRNPGHTPLNRAGRLRTGT
ncbi:winged helix-turn-helix transcriptional regulator [Streptomyces mirabilis]|uniref:winged helix-turn-helix transcriptional regulator n=1 Tax=Streptomyces mirabilis TaxID=68239 RepID=UPI003816BA55